MHETKKCGYIRSGKKGKKSLIEKYHPFNDYKWCCVIGRNVLLSMRNHDGLWTRQTWPSDFNIFSYIFYCNIITIIQAMSAISGRTGAIIANRISPLFWTDVIFRLGKNFLFIQTFVWIGLIQVNFHYVSKWVMTFITDVNRNKSIPLYENSFPLSP